MEKVTTQEAIEQMEYLIAKTNNYPYEKIVEKVREAYSLADRILRIEKLYGTSAVSNILTKKAKVFINKYYQYCNYTSYGEEVLEICREIAKLSLKIDSIFESEDNCVVITARRYGTTTEKRDMVRRMFFSSCFLKKHFDVVTTLAVLASHLCEELEQNFDSNLTVL